MHISDLLKFPVQKSKATSERAMIIEDFLVRLNFERNRENWVNWKRHNKLQPITRDEFKKTKFYFKPLEARAVAIKLGHIKNNSELYWFYKTCENAKCGFSKCFWGSLKIRLDK